MMQGQGITILMIFSDHNPSHFYERYGEHRARVVLDGTILDGHLHGDYEPVNPARSSS